MKKTIVLLSMMAFSLCGVDDSVLTKGKTTSTSDECMRIVLNYEIGNNELRKQLFRERTEGHKQSLKDGCLLGTLVTLGCSSMAIAFLMCLNSQ